MNREGSRNGRTEQSEEAIRGTTIGAAHGFVAFALVSAALAGACGGQSGFDSGSFDDGGGAAVGTTSSNGSDGGSTSSGGSSSGSGSSSGGSTGSGPTGDDAGQVVTGGSSGGSSDSGATSGDGAAAACTLGSASVLGLIPGGTMAPGLACVSCHIATGAGKLNFAGTVFPTLHEPDNCLGSSTGLQVIITDAQGTDHSLSVNSTGNFYDNSLFGFSTPYKARVVGPAGTVAMVSSQTSGDCNSCHTVAGTQGAAGRIIGP